MSTPTSNSDGSRVDGVPTVSQTMPPYITYMPTSISTPFPSWSPTMPPQTHFPSGEIIVQVLSFKIRSNLMSFFHCFSESRLPSLMPSYSPSTVPTSSIVPSISQSPSLEPSTSLAPSLSGRPSLGPSTTLAPSLSCYELWIEIQYDDYPAETSFELISIDDGIIVPRQYGTIYEDGGQTRKKFVCLDPGEYQFRMYDSYGDGFWGSYNLKLQSGETIIDRNRDGLDWDDSTVDGFGEIVRFDLPFRTLEIEAIGGNPTESPTFSTQPSVSISTMPSWAPTISIHPSITQNPSASQAPSIAVPRGATLVGEGICVDSSNEGYATLKVEASEFKGGFSAQLCLEKCISLSSIIQLHLRGFETEYDGVYDATDIIHSSPCACLFDHDPDDTSGAKFTEELKRENGFDDYGLYSNKGVGSVTSVISPDYGNPFCYAVDNDVSIKSWISAFQHPQNYLQTNFLARHHFLALQHTLRRR